MTGIDLAPVQKLRDAVSCQITVAGGVSTLDEVIKIAALGCDVQLGMALYTGKINLSDAFVASLNWKKGAPSTSTRTPQRTRPPKGGLPLLNIEESPCAGACYIDSSTPLDGAQTLLPIIVQSPDGQVLMTGYTDTEALAETFKRGNVCFHSRTRNRLWMKGETSGNVLKLIRLRADCDRDALLATAEPAGPVCHTGAWACFATNKNYTWEYLQDIIAERFCNPAPGSYTATLDDELVREKLLEEAQELCEAKNHDEMVWEAADLLYFATALMTRAGVTVQEILDELDRRHKK
jgi:phosphoribosyl-ATP pyrophosphohydrolase/phosphoribosyl-AMP cyclohydrolase